MTLKDRILLTRDTWSLTIVRVFLGLIILPHGAQKLFGWFGGHGAAAFMQAFESVSALPGWLGWLVIIIEFIGSLCLILGFWTRVWALSFIGLFVGIILTVHIPNGFFMNWSGSQAGEGFEYHLLVIGMAWALAMGGAGRLSIDQTMASEERKF